MSQPHAAQPVSRAVLRYVWVFVTLAALTLLTLAIAYIDLGGANAFVAVIIAAAKATLVLLFFMHVSTSSLLVRATIGAACLWLGILVSFTLLDYATRRSLTAPTAPHDQPIPLEGYESAAR